MPLIRITHQELSDLAYSYFGLEAEAQPLNVEAFCNVVMGKGDRAVWIKTSECAPEDDQTVFCHSPAYHSTVPIMAYYDEESKGFYALFTWQDLLIHPEYWMPLPEPPNQDSE